MRTVKCRECGTNVLVTANIVDDMFDEVKKYHKLAMFAKNKQNKNVYISISTSIRKMAMQILHRHSQIFERNLGSIGELSEIVYYLKSNNLISLEKLQELRNLGREKAKIRDKVDDDILKRIYGDYETFITNRTKNDKVAMEALNNIHKITKEEFDRTYKSKPGRDKRK